MKLVTMLHFQIYMLMFHNSDKLRNIMISIISQNMSFLNMVYKITRYIICDNVYLKLARNPSSLHSS